MQKWKGHLCARLLGQIKYDPFSMLNSIRTHVRIFILRFLHLKATYCSSRLGKILSFTATKCYSNKKISRLNIVYKTLAAFNSTNLKCTHVSSPRNRVACSCFQSQLQACPSTYTKPCLAPIASVTGIPHAKGSHYSAATT